MTQLPQGAGSQQSRLPALFGNRYRLILRHFFEKKPLYQLVFSIVFRYDRVIKFVFRNEIF
jgi:hypothetical protein